MKKSNLNTRSRVVRCGFLLLSGILVFAGLSSCDSDILPSGEDISQSGSGGGAPTGGGTGQEEPQREFFVSEQARLTANDAGTGDFFASSVAIDGEYAVVGAVLDGDGGASAGAAYIFKYDSDTSTWEEEAKLRANDADSYDLFGDFVAIDGDYVIVSAGYDGDGGVGSGAAYIFKRDASTSIWEQEAKLVADDPSAGANFSSSVAISGEYALVGAYFADNEGVTTGAAYVFKRNASSSTWSQHAKIVPDDAAEYDFFGTSVAMDGDHLIIGASLNDEAGSNAGAAYIYAHDAATSTWSEEAKLTIDDSLTGDIFGSAVAISGEYVIVTSTGRDHDNGIINSGSAYIFKHDAGTSTWAQEAQLNADDPAQGDNFGVSVAIHNGYAIVGADNADSGTVSDSGAAYIFKRDDDGTSWTQQAKLSDDNAANGDGFGGSVAIGSEHAIVGVEEADEAGIDAGAAPVYTLFRE